MIKKIIIAPDSFKGTLTASEVCDILSTQAAAFIPNVECVSLPVADGGEGLVSALHAACGGSLVEKTVRGPLGEPVKAVYAILADGAAAIEMSAAAGITLLPRERLNIMRASTLGVGELILDAVAHDCKRIILGLGGSATNDGGMGLGRALGIRYFDKDGADVSPSGENAGSVASVDFSGVDGALKDMNFNLACDVDNPLCGERGAAAIYGPQKGATPEQVKALDKGLSSLCGVLEKACGMPLRDVAGMGAAGGIALPLCAFFDAQIASGLDVVLSAQRFDEVCADCDLVITGEGCTDAQSAMGKAVSGVAARAKRLGKPVFVLSGALADGCEQLNGLGVDAMFSTSWGTKTTQWQLEHAREALSFSAAQLFRAINAVNHT